VPFVHRGRTRELGLDCVGLLVLCAQELGRKILDYDRYGKNPNPKELLRRMQLTADRVDKPAVGAIALTHVRSNMRFPHHVAIITRPPSHCRSSVRAGQLWMVHAYEESGVVVDNAYAAPWTKQTDCFWKLKDLG